MDSMNVEGSSWNHIDVNKTFIFLSMIFRIYGSMRNFQHPWNLSIPITILFFHIHVTFLLDKMFFKIEKSFFRLLKCSSHCKKKMVLVRTVHWKVLQGTKNGSSIWHCCQTPFLKHLTAISWKNILHIKLNMVLSKTNHWEVLGTKNGSSTIWKPYFEECDDVSRMIAPQTHIISHSSHSTISKQALQTCPDKSQSLLEWLRCSACFEFPTSMDKPQAYS